MLTVIEPTVSLWSNTTSITEDSSTPATFTVSRSGNTSSALTVYLDSGGYATDGVDYTYDSGSLPESITIAPGQATATIALASANDTDAEIDEYAWLAVVPHSGYIVHEYQYLDTFVIEDDDLPMVSITAFATSIGEGSSQSDAFTVHRTGNLADPLEVCYLPSGTATDAVDYYASLCVTIQATHATAAIYLSAVDDSNVEGSEQVTFNLTGSDHYTISGTNPSAMLTIDDGDVYIHPTVSLWNSTYSIQESYPGPAYTFFLFRDGDISSPLTVSLTWAGSATNGTDYGNYGAMPSSVTFAANYAVSEIYIVAVDDFNYEGSESLSLALVADSGYNIAPGADARTVEIVDNDSLPVVSVSVDTTAISEASTGNGATFTFTRDNYVGEVVVNFQLSGSANFGSDYTDYSGLAGGPNSILIPHGSSSVSFTVYPLDDSEDDDNEAIWLDLSGGTYTVGSAFAAVGIEDNDTFISVPSGGSIIEGDSAPGTFTVYRSGDNSMPLTVFLAVGGSANNGTDYIYEGYGGVPSSITIAAYQSSASIIINAVDDNEYEGVETVTIGIAPGSGYLVDIYASCATITIADSDAGDDKYLLQVNSTLALGASDVANSLRENDYGPGSLVLLSSPANGQITAWDSQTGIFSYVPNTDFTGIDEFTYKLDDGGSAQRMATVKVYVVSGDLDFQAGVVGNSVLSETAEDAPGGALALSIPNSRHFGRAIVRPAAPITPNGYYTIVYPPELTLWLDAEGTDLVISGETEIPHDQTTILYVQATAVAANLEIELVWHEGEEFAKVAGESEFSIDTIKVNVWKFDLDIDSDNSDGFSWPDNSDWEELLEDHAYGLGKLVMQNYVWPTGPSFTPADRFTPMRLRLPTGLDPNDPNLRLRINFEEITEAGEILLYTKQMNDPLRNNEHVVETNTLYSLSELLYDPGAGVVTLYIAGIKENAAIKTLKGVEDNGRPNEFITATLLAKSDAEFQVIATDAVKYVVTQARSFLYLLEFEPSVRYALASRAVYTRADMLNFCLEIVDADGLASLGIPFDSPDAVGNHLNDESIPGFRAGLYRNYLWKADRDDRFVLAFAGSGDGDEFDAAEDALVGLAEFSPLIPVGTTQFPIAMDIAVTLRDVDAISSDYVITGHSLGGGLASIAAIAADIPAMTFNAAGVSEYMIYKHDPETFELEVDGNGNYIESYLGTYNRFIQEDGENPLLVSAVHVDFDVLTAVQNAIPFAPMALGAEFTLNGFHHGLEALIPLITVITDWFNSDDPPAGWLAMVANIQVLVESHFMYSVLYGLLVVEDSYGVKIEDLQGYSLGLVW